MGIQTNVPYLCLQLAWAIPIKSVLVHDFSITKSFQLSEGTLDIGLGVMNAFDKKAPLLYDAPDFSFDTRVHDPRGRLINFTAELNL
jgi:iron complex outermembrane receptor protein